MQDSLVPAWSRKAFSVYACSCRAPSVQPGGTEFPLSQPGAAALPKYGPGSGDSVFTPSQSGAAEFVYLGLEPTDSLQPGAAELPPS